MPPDSVPDDVEARTRVERRGNRRKRRRVDRVAAMVAHSRIGQAEFSILRLAVASIAMATLAVGGWASRQHEAREPAVSPPESAASAPADPA